MNYFPHFEPSRFADGEIDWPPASPKRDVAVNRMDRRFHCEDRFNISLEPFITPKYHNEMMPQDGARNAHFNCMYALHFCSMLISERASHYAAEKGILKEDAVEKGMADKSAELV